MEFGRWGAEDQARHQRLSQIQGVNHARTCRNATGQLGVGRISPRPAGVAPAGSSLTITVSGGLPTSTRSTATCQQKEKAQQTSVQ